MRGSWTKAILLIGGLVLPTAACRASEPIAVTELFTSQGCDGCVTANNNEIRLSEEPGVLALTFSVTYLDYLGWRDSYGQPVFTDRQAAYEPRLGYRIPFTPQIIINGKATSDGADLYQLAALLKENSLGPVQRPKISIAAKAVTVDKATAPLGGADVWLIGYDPGVKEVTVGAGANVGRTQKNVNVVRLLSYLGPWSGERVSFRLMDSQDKLKRAILVQVSNGGPIVAATDVPN